MRRFGLWMVFATVGGLLARATTLVPPHDLGELASRSEAVVLAEAGSSRVIHRGPLLFTSTPFTVLSRLSGPVNEGGLLEVEVPGGHEHGGGWLVPGSPRFRPGARYLLLLQKGRAGRWRPAALSYGLLESTRGAQGVALLAPLPESSQAQRLSRPDSGPFEPVGTYLEAALLDHLARVVGGKVAWDGRLALAPEGALAEGPSLAPPSECSFMNAGYNLRWNVFDSGSTTVAMYADSEGDRSLSGGGFSQVQGAVSGWMAVPDTSLSLAYGGPLSFTLACTGGDDAPPSGTHVVVFNDPCSDMADMSACTGVLAFGGPWYGGTHTFDGETWYTIQSWFVVVNNEAGCIGPYYYQLMIQHELGHGLGFGHVSDPLALMYAYCCNPVNLTDVACAQYAYPKASAPSLAVNLGASPASGPLPLAVTLTADVSGSATGSLTYAFWWNCASASTSLSGASNTCGGLPNPSPGSCAQNDNGARCNQVAASPQSVTHTYGMAGSYTAKVIVERGTAAPVESRAAVSVTGVPPAAPTNLVATALSSSQVKLAWKDNSSDELSFKVERKTGTSGGWAQIAAAAADQTSYVNAGLDPSTLYTYRVRAYGPGGDSAYSNEYGATTAPGSFVASASSWPAAGPAPLMVHFSGEGRGGQSPYAYEWNFGDGSAHSSEQSPTHPYTLGGTFEWLLTVTDASSQAATAAGSVKVGAPLVAAASASPLSGDAPLTVWFTGSASGGTSPYTLSWTFGDGASSPDADVVHTYAEPGTYTASLTATDGTGQGATSSVTLHATTPVPPPILARVEVLSGPFRLRVSGLNFHAVCTIRIDGSPVPQTVWKNSGSLVAKGGAPLKAMLPKGTPVQITVVNNDDGGVSGPFTFTR